MLARQFSPNYQELKPQRSAYYFFKLQKEGRLARRKTKKFSNAENLLVQTHKERFFFSLEYIFFGQSKQIAFYTGQSNLRLGLIRFSPDNVVVFPFHSVLGFYTWLLNCFTTLVGKFKMFTSNTFLSNKINSSLRRPCIRN